MSQPLNRYKADLRDVKFLLWEQFKLQDLLGKAPYANWGREEVDTVLEEVLSWVQKVTGPYNTIGDAVGCTTMVPGATVGPEVAKTQPGSTSARRTSRLPT